MTDQIVEWLMKYSPVNPLFVVATFSLLMFFVFYGSQLKNWTSVSGDERFAMISILLGIAVILAVGILDSCWCSVPEIP